MTTCEPCPPGTFSGVGNSSCVPCARGTYANGIGSAMVCAFLDVCLDAKRESKPVLGAVFNA
jgi:hypothetical protein